ncbi:MAG: TonB family protein [Bacteroidia bacterium]
MKKIAYIFLFVVLTGNFFGQDTTKKETFTVVEKMPEFPGGPAEMMRYINRKMSNLDNSSTIVLTYVKFVVDSSGNISNAKTIRSSGIKELDQKCIDVINGMPTWIPGSQNGKKVNVYFNVPIKVAMTNKQYDEYLVEKNNKKKADKFYNDGVKKVNEKREKEAAEDFKSCLALNPNDIDALYNLGAVYITLNQKSDACESWNKIKLMGKPDADELIKQYCTN